MFALNYSPQILLGANLIEGLVCPIDYDVAMPPKFYTTAGHLLVCQGKSCQSRGSALLYKALWNHLEKKAMSYYKKGGNLRLSESSCLGACSYGPTLCVYRQQTPQLPLEQAWYAACDFGIASHIATAVHQGSELPHQNRYDITTDMPDDN